VLGDTTDNSKEHHHQHNTSARRKMKQAPTFSKNVPTRKQSVKSVPVLSRGTTKKLKNRTSMVNTDIQQHRRTKTREVKTRREWPLIVADKKKGNPGQKNFSNPSLTSNYPM
jgi:hypothetical protein